MCEIESASELMIQNKLRSFIEALGVKPQLSAHPGT